MGNIMGIPVKLTDCIELREHCTYRPNRSFGQSGSEPWFGAAGNLSILLPLPAGAGLVPAPGLS